MVLLVLLVQVEMAHFTIEGRKREGEGRMGGWQADEKTASQIRKTAVPCLVGGKLRVSELRCTRI